MCRSAKRGTSQDSLLALVILVGEHDVGRFMSDAATPIIGVVRCPGDDGEDPWVRPARRPTWHDRMAPRGTELACQPFAMYVCGGLPSGTSANFSEAPR